MPVDILWFSASLSGVGLGYRTVYIEGSIILTSDFHNDPIPKRYECFW